MGGLARRVRRYDHSCVTPERQRRRIDLVLDPTFLDSLADAIPADLRAKLRDARSEEDALSYIRRNLHGRLDLLRAEIERRRKGDAGDRDVTALAVVLTEAAPPTRGTRVGLALRAAAMVGRRSPEEILSEDHLARLDELDEEDLAVAAERTERAERDMSSQRQRLHAVIDVLEAELAQRYKSGLEPTLERLQ